MNLESKLKKPKHWTQYLSPNLVLLLKRVQQNEEIRLKETVVDSFDAGATDEPSLLALHCAWFIYEPSLCTLQDPVKMSTNGNESSIVERIIHIATTGNGKWRWSKSTSNGLSDCKGIEVSHEKTITDHEITKDAKELGEKIRIWRREKIRWRMSRNNRKVHSDGFR